jgi:hypothetical protein
MTDKTSKLSDELKKSMKEFDIAATCLAEAMQAFHERLERIEQWITNEQEIKILTTGTAKK